ncbi:MAG TPA: EamA family transporter [Rhodocyclaceae bacterium]
MKTRAFDYLYVALSIAFTVYGQLVLKWRMQGFGPLPVGTLEKLRFLLSLVVDPVIFSAFFAAFLASLAWMAAMTKFQLSHAYPFMSLTFVAVLLLGHMVLAEPLSLPKVIGTALIVLGTIVASQG